jgi:outer membrane protein assembly factor BamB
MEKVFEYPSGTPETFSQTGSHLSKSLMKYSSFTILYGVGLLLALVAPAACAVTPLWIEPGTVGGELSGVVISADGSTIVAGGDQLIALSRDGEKLWTGWSATCLDISRDGNYILTSRGQVVRLISGTGTMIWERNMEIPVTDISMAAERSIFAATGGGRTRTMAFSGLGIASNTTMAVNHLRIMPDGNRIVLTTNKNVQLSNFTLFSEWSDANSTQNLITVAADGSSFVTATDNRVRMYSGRGNLLWDQKFPGGNAQALASSRDGSLIVIGKDDHTVQALNSDGTLLWSGNATNWITSIAVSDDGSTIAAGSMDKKLYVYNHVGNLLGTFTTKSAIKFNSVAVTGDGSLIIVVDETAVYGLQRSAFIPQATAVETIPEQSPDVTVEMTTAPMRVTTTLSPATWTPVTFSPVVTSPGGETAEAALPLAVPLIALGFLLLFRSYRP